MSDQCCHICRSQFGVCLTDYRCDHHIATRRREEADDQARKLYNNPTADKAIANVMGRRKRR